MGKNMINMKKILNLIILLMVITCGFNVCRANNGFALEMDSLMKSVYYESAPGAAVLVAYGDSVLFEGYYGTSDMELQTPVDSSTVFNIASISKQFTVASILKLQEKGKLSIDDSVASFFPEYRSDIWQKVKLRHIMSQSSGIPDLRPRDDRNFMLYANDSQSMEYFKDLDSLKFEPGTEYDYVNPTFLLLAEIIHRIEGIEFVDFQKRNIFKPAGMTSTCYFNPDEEIPHSAHGYVPNGNVMANVADMDSFKSYERTDDYFIDNRGRQWAECDYGEETFFATRPDGGIYSTARDLLKWEALLSSHEFIGAASLDNAYSRQVKVSGSQYSTYQNRANTWYGYGWFVDDTPGRPVKIYHTGDNGGFQAYLAKYAGSLVRVIILSNRNDVDRWKLQNNVEILLVRHGIL